MHVLAGTSGFSYKEWKGSFYPEDLPAEEMLSFYAARLPAVEINNTFYRMPKPALLDVVGGAGLAAVPVRAEGLAADHASQAPEGSGQRGRLLLPDGVDPRRPPRTGALPASAESQEGPAAARGVPRGPARGRARGLRVPPRLVVRRRRLRGAPWAGRGALRRRGRGARDPARGHGRLGVPAVAPPGLRRRRGRRLGREGPRARPGARPTSSSSTRTPGRGPRLAAKLLELFA